MWLPNRQIRSAFIWNLNDRRFVHYICATLTTLDIYIDTQVLSFKVFECAPHLPLKREVWFTFIKHISWHSWINFWGKGRCIIFGEFLFGFSKSAKNHIFQNKNMRIIPWMSSLLPPWWPSATKKQPGAVFLRSVCAAARETKLFL